MATATITSNTTTTIDVPAGRHLLEVYGTFDGVQLVVRHAGSEIPFLPLSPVSAATAKIITTGGESLELWSVSAGASTSVTVRVNSTATKRGTA